MKIFLSTLLLALVIGSPVGQARAVEWPSEQRLGSSNRYEAIRAWHNVEHLFSVERLSRDAFARYALALAQGQCDRAVEVLWREFMRLEPELKGRARSGDVAQRWRRSVVPFRFPEHAFCDASQGYNRTTELLAEKPGEPAPETAVLGYAERPNTDVMLSDRALLITTLQVLFNVAHNGNPEAIRFVLEQDRVGRFVNLTDEQRLSLLLRLARLGASRPDERARAMKLAQEVPLATAAAARAYAAREVEPEFERWQAYQRRLRAIGTMAPPPGSP